MAKHIDYTGYTIRDSEGDLYKVRLVESVDRFPTRPMHCDLCDLTAVYLVESAWQVAGWPVSVGYCQACLAEMRATGEDAWTPPIDLTQYINGNLPNTTEV